MNRQATITSIRNNPHVSVLIIGGGINGIGCFRDLALQGVDVLLVERGDFCSGASAASSHMVHGGIRYLENGEFRLVSEAVKERNRLLENAPHYVHPLATTIPIFKWFSGVLNAPLKFLGVLDKPSERGALIIKLGLMMYDAYTGGTDTVPPHQFESRQQALARFPQLNPSIVSAATYYDAAMHAPERICMELVLDAEAVNERVRALNYASAAFVSGDSAVDTVMVHDEITGETLPVKPGLVINAAGPWIDIVNRRLSQETNLIGGTKGSHLVLDHAELRAAIGDNEFFFENKDGRIVLIYPFLDKVMVGTSDIRLDDPDAARCTDEEITYFLDMIGRVFPAIAVDRSHIVFTFSGVRPLPASDANSTGQISRDHSIRVSEPDGRASFPVLNLIGGKWTTFRAFAEKTADVVLERLGLLRKTSTRKLAIGGGKAYPRTLGEQARWFAELHSETGVSQERIAALFQRYGTRAAAVARFIAAGEQSGAPDAPLAHHSGYSRREIAFLAQHEKVLHLDDLVLRRTLLGFLGELTGELLEEVATVVGDALGWSATQRADEIQRVRTIFVEQHRTHIPAASPEKTSTLLHAEPSDEAADS